MSVRVIVVLGLFLLLAALAHGGIYAAGHDFVVNRFTGRFEFVPAEEGEEATTPARWTLSHACRRLTSSGPASRVVGLHHRR